MLAAFLPVAGGLSFLRPLISAASHICGLSFLLRQAGRGALELLLAAAGAAAGAWQGVLI